jgi:hypothetical protein
MSKKLLVVILSVVGIFALAACEKKSEPAPVTAPAAEAPAAAPAPAPAAEAPAAPAVDKK